VNTLGRYSAETLKKQVSAGSTFSLFLTGSGKVYAAGSSETGQLGNGKTGERIAKSGMIGYDFEAYPSELAVSPNLIKSRR
jgi:alpha-tubulin suppressor-like RCC1 family protein